MKFKDRFQQSLKNARHITDRMLADFHSPQEWTHQSCPGANHALWLAGHIGMSDNFFLSVVAPERAKSPPGYREKFGMGSTPSASAADYPAPEEVLAFMRERRETLLDVLAKLSEDDLAKKTAPGTPHFLPDNASVFETAIWHEGLHAGQLSIARRALGKKSVMG